MGRRRWPPLLGGPASGRAAIAELREALERGWFPRGSPEIVGDPRLYPHRPFVKVKVQELIPGMVAERWEWRSFGHRPRRAPALARAVWRARWLERAMRHGREATDQAGRWVSR
jgi:hypothetical protein